MGSQSEKTQPEAATINLYTMDKNQLLNYAIEATASLQRTAKRLQLVTCELQLVDRANKIFDYKEGVLDKKHLYITRKCLKEGIYQKMRDGARIRTLSQNRKA